MSLLDMVIRRDGGTCAWCGRQTRGSRQRENNLWGASCDHVIPRAFGGRSVAENMVVACRRCNGERGFLHFSEWHSECRRRGYASQDDLLYAAYWRALEHGRISARLLRARQPLIAGHTIWESLTDEQRDRISDLNAALKLLGRSKKTLEPECA